MLGDDFEPRAEQRCMAEAVERAMATGGRLFAEAGTGVGKSFAYLLPAIRRILAHGERVVVTTNTIALQEQLVEKDIPLLESIFADGDGEPAFRAALVKGRNNYVSIRRLQLASKRQERLFPDAAARRSLHVIEDWAYKTADGSLATLPQIERPGVWDRVQSDSGNCMGRRCPMYTKCFFQRSRRRAERADLLICNHALFCSDLALRGRGVGFLPKYDHVIIDEAHSFEDVASDHFGLSLSEGRVQHLLSVLHHARTNKGFLADLELEEDGSEATRRAVQAAHNASESARVFFDRLAERARREGGAQGDDAATVRLREAGAVDNLVTPVFNDLTLHLKRLREKAAREEDRYELNSYIERSSAIAHEAEALIEQSLEGCVYWVEAARRGRGSRITLACSPIEVGPALRSALFDQELSVTMTSATLTIGGSFNHAMTRLGCEEAETLALGSPFDFAAQVEVHIESSMPDPRSGEHMEALCAQIERHVRETDGGAFVLFTSYASLRAAARRLRKTLAEDDIPVLAQGEDGTRSAILETFRASGRAALLGTSSFWQGVDVRGDALRNVIITRLPFEPPDRPLTQARLERIAERGGDPFREDSLPRAALRFRQGIGRLVRSSADRGRIVVLDPRIVTRGYGRAFLQALPAPAEAAGE